MQPWEAYQIYTALKLHFESASYDAIKYNYKSSASQKSFLLRKDRFHFAKLARKYPERQQLIDFLVANFTQGGTKWAGTLLDKNAEDLYLKWMKTRDSFTYYFTEQVDTLGNLCVKDSISFDAMLKGDANNCWPPIVRYYSENEIGLESVVVFDLLLDFVKSQTVTETVFWPEFKQSVHKYGLFLRSSVDLKKCKQIILKRFTSVEC